MFPYENLEVYMKAYKLPGILILLLHSIVAPSFYRQIEHRARKLTEVSTNATPIIFKKLVDYKGDTYKISLGDNYTISDKFIDWRWAVENDNDRRLDSIGSNTFIYLGEPLLKYNSTEYLPTLNIETKGNFITFFSCTILFELEESDKAGNNFLILISKDIKHLDVDSIRSKIAEGGVYKIATKEYIESYTLTKGKDLYAKFEYIVKVVDKSLK